MTNNNRKSFKTDSFIPILYKISISKGKRIVANLQQFFFLSLIFTKNGFTTSYLLNFAKTQHVLFLQHILFSILLTLPY